MPFRGSNGSCKYFESVCEWMIDCVKRKQESCKRESLWKDFKSIQEITLFCVLKKTLIVAFEGKGSLYFGALLCVCVCARKSDTVKTEKKEI